MILYAVYRTMRTFYVTIWFYTAPIIVFVLSYQLPNIWNAIYSEKLDA